MAPDFKGTQKKITSLIHDKGSLLMKHLFMLIVMAGLLAAGIVAADTTVDPEQNLLLIYSNDVVGETEPCG